MAADRAKFEQMLEFLINEDKTKAEELFHELVVAKSREIYENLLDDDMEIDEEVDEEETDEDEEVTEEVSDEEADDMLDDLDGSDEDEEGDEGDEVEGEDDDEVTKGDLDLMKQDIIDALTAEFEQMMAGQDAGEEEGDMDMDMGAEEEEGGEEEMAAEMFGDDEMVMEYTQKVSAKMGDNGANTKSAVASANKMGGTSANIVKGSSEEKGRSAPSTKEDSAGNVNVPGGNAAKSMSNAKKPAGGDDGANTKSTVGA